MISQNTLQAKNTIITGINKAVASQNISSCAKYSYDVYSKQVISPILGSIGHSIDIDMQKTVFPDPLFKAFSNHFPDILCPKFVAKTMKDPNYHNFVASDQQFTMLTEALVASGLSMLFPDSFDSVELNMNRSISLNLFPLFHTGQLNSDNRCSTTLPSGRKFEFVTDTKRTSAVVLDKRVKFYLNNKTSNKPIYSNVHIVNDVKSNDVVSNELYVHLVNQMQETKDFYILNRSYYTVDEFKAIEEAVNESLKFEVQFKNSGKFGAHNKILYNAAKFVTSDEMCSLLKIPKLF